MFDDVESMSAILNSTNPKQMKMMGTKVKNFDSNKWNEVAHQVMAIANLRKVTSIVSVFGGGGAFCHCE